MTTSHFSSGEPFKYEKNDHQLLSTDDLCMLIYTDLDNIIDTLEYRYKNSNKTLDHSQPYTYLNSILVLFFETRQTIVSLKSFFFLDCRESI